MTSNSSENNNLNNNLKDFSEPLERYKGKTFLIKSALSTATSFGKNVAYEL